MLLDELVKYKNFVIYGAQVVAYGAYVAIKGLLDREPFCFAVSSLNNNPNKIDEIPVMEIKDVPKDVLIVVGVTELIQKEVLPMLNEMGYKNVITLTQKEEFSLMSKYFESIGEFSVFDSNQESHFGGSELDFAIYEVSNHRDQPLRTHPTLLPYEYSIQAGRTIADRAIAPITDDTGVNISSKNKQYCEMTATYWVWKNTTHDWKGIEHYRRHIILNPELIDDEVDAILPLPYICYPNTMAQFRRFVDDSVYEALLEALEYIHPDEYEAYKQIIFGKYQYTYNIVCAKRAVFDDYCKWFFEITEYMETMADRVPDIKNTRALSYVAEVLTNIYFMSMQDKLCIRHVPREIYV